MLTLRRLAAALALLLGLMPAASQAATFTGTLYYTHFTGGGDNVLKVNFNYDSTTQVLTLDLRHFRAMTPLQGGSFTILSRSFARTESCACGSWYLVSLRWRSVSAIAATIATSSTTAASSNGNT